jgi:hypothetical protein
VNDGTVIIAQLNGVTNHPKLGNVPWVTTSMVLGITYDMETMEVIGVKTLNTDYTIYKEETTNGTGA